MFKLTSPLEFGVDHGTPACVIRGVQADGTTVKAVLADAIAGPNEVAEQLGEPLTPAYEPGDYVAAMGYWKKEWFVVLIIGRHQP